MREASLVGGDAIELSFARSTDASYLGRRHQNDREARPRRSRICRVSPSDELHHHDADRLLGASADVMLDCFFTVLQELTATMMKSTMLDACRPIGKALQA